MKWKVNKIAYTKLDLITKNATDIFLFFSYQYKMKDCGNKKSLWVKAPRSMNIPCVMLTEFCSPLQRIICYWIVDDYMILIKMLN